MMHVMPLRLMLIVGLLATSAFAQDPDERPAAETIIRTYNISDLMRASRDYPLDSEIIPPSGFGAAGTDFFEVAASAAPPRAAGDLAAPLSNLIMDLIDTHSWHDNGGEIGQIKPFASLLVITQTKENHEKIQQLLDEIRKSAGASQVVAVRATWVTAPGGEVPRAGSVVDDAWLADKRVYCEGQLIGFSGQTVHITSGRGHTIVTNLTPIVGTQSVAYDPSVERIHSGVALQVAPQLVPGTETAILDLHSFASEYGEPGEPIRLSGGSVTDQGEETRIVGQIDRLDVTVQELKTTLRVPLNRKVLVGGMTLDPAAEAEDRLYLVVEVQAMQ